MSKRYYWLKLQNDFFKQHDIRIVESMPNGKDYILFYLKLLVESVSHDGELRFSETIPYNESMLATVTDTNIDVVRSAMKIFMELGMIEVLDDQTIYMSEVQKMIGSETENARYVRDYRNRQKVLETLHCNDDVKKCNTELEIELELEKELEIEIDNNNLLDSKESNCQKLAKQSFQQAVEAWNSLEYLGIKPISKISSDSQRYKMLNARLKQYGLESYMKAIENIRNSDFLQGRTGNRPFIITFDWFVRPNNFPKVLDGNYNHSTKPTSNNEWGV